MPPSPALHPQNQRQHPTNPGSPQEPEKSLVVEMTRGGTRGKALSRLFRQAPPALGNPATDAGFPHSHSHNNDGLQKTEPTSNQDQHQQQNQGRLHRRVDTPVTEKGDISNVISKGTFLLSVDMGT